MRNHSGILVVVVEKNLCLNKEVGENLSRNEQRMICHEALEVIVACCLKNVF